LQPLTQQLGWQIEEPPPYFTNWKVRPYHAKVLHYCLEAITGEHHAASHRICEIAFAVIMLMLQIPLQLSQNSKLMIFSKNGGKEETKTVSRGRILNIQMCEKSPVKFWKNWGFLL
jgi:hypothetical protein